MSVFKRVALFALAISLASPVAAGPTFQSGDQLSVTGNRSDMAFAAGGEISVDATISDTLFVTGGDLSFVGGTISSIIASGGSLNFRGTQAGDVIAAGGELRFDQGSVADDVVLAGGQIDIAPGFAISSSAVIAGGQVTIGGSIGDDLSLRAGDIKITGDIAGNADLAGGNIVIGPGARIGGNLTHRARHIEISPDAVITGKITALPSGPPDRQIFGLAVAGFIAFAIIYFLGTTLVALAITALAPGLMATTAARIRSAPLMTLLIGLVWLVAVPILCFVLLATLIGIPLALLLIGFYIVAFPLGGIAAVHFTGMTLRALTGKKEEPRLGGRLGWTLIGAIVLCVLAMIPFVGGLIWFVAGTIGLGAFVAELGHTIRREPAMA